MRFLVMFPSTTSTPRWIVLLMSTWLVCVGVPAVHADIVLSHATATSAEATDIVKLEPLKPLAAGFGAPDNPDLLYYPATGNVQIDPDGENIVSFFIQSANQFLPPADFSDLDDHVGVGASPVFDNETDQIGWTSALAIQDRGFGFNGPDIANLGPILPPGLDQAGLESLITGQQWSRQGVVASFDLAAIPEPNAFALALVTGGIVVCGATCRRIVARRQVNRKK